MTRDPRLSISLRVHRDLPACCRNALWDFAQNDYYAGAGEPGDRVGCDCGNILIYGRGGAWHVAEPKEGE